MTRIHNIKSFNEWADFWYNEIGINVIPANTKEKKTFENWTIWQAHPIPVEVHESYKKAGYYKNGIAIITGKIWRGPNQGKYLVSIDLDNKKAIEEFVGSNISLEDLKQVTLVEQHADPTKMHIYFIVDREIPNKSSDKTNIDTLLKINENEIPALEVKSNGRGIMFCTPSSHLNGSNYQIIGTLKPRIFSAKEVEQKISLSCEKYKIPYGSRTKSTDDYNKIPIEDLFKVETRIHAGHNRHEALLRVMESLLQRNRQIMTLEEIEENAQKINQRLCIPPLDEIEFKKQWKCAVKFVKQSINNHITINSGGSRDRDLKRSLIEHRKESLQYHDSNFTSNSNTYIEEHSDIKDSRNISRPDPSLLESMKKKE